jgi:hypothetical protein
MARANTWTNADGLSVGFGIRDSKNDNAGQVQTEGNVEILQFPIDYDVYDVIGTAPQSKSIPIPAGATILRGNVRATTIWAGGTSINFGTMLASGTAIQAAGLASAVAIASLDTVNKVVLFTGAQIGTAVSTDAYFGMAFTGTFTAGAGIVTIEYIRPMPGSASPAPITGIVGTL